MQKRNVKINYKVGVNVSVPHQVLQKSLSSDDGVNQTKIVQFRLHHPQLVHKPMDHIACNSYEIAGSQPSMY